MKITCPYCGCEYLPQEIYIPEDFLPELDDLTKDDAGHIVAVHEEAMHTCEEYTCDRCNHRFRVIAKVEFSSAKADEHDLLFPHESSLYQEPRMELAEHD